MVNVGKAGLSQQVVTQVKQVLHKKKLLKVKFLRSFTDANDGKTVRVLATELAEKVNAQLIDVVGLTVILAKKQ